MFRGFVHSLQIRDDGWAEAILQAVHAGNAKQTFLIHDLDGNATVANRRLAQLSLLRDAVARVLPVEVDYSTGEEGQGNVIQDVTIYPRPSFDSRPGVRRAEGVVIGSGIVELGPLAGTTPYRDAPDLAGVTLLEDDGSVESFLVDLQRPDPLTGQAILALLREAHRTRRPVILLVSSDAGGDDRTVRLGAAAPTASGPTDAGYVQACEWKEVPAATLDYVYAYVERIGQRYESYDSSEAWALSSARVVYTTAPGQTPEGDISDNGTFTPNRLDAWVHDDSPLLRRLEAALRDELQVKLGLLGDRIHEVELVAGLGSVAKPVWIKTDRCVLPPEPDDCLCENVPTTQFPTNQVLDELRVRAAWRAQAFFSEGIWRFVLISAVESGLQIDGKSPCCPVEPRCELPSVEDEMTTSRLLGKGTQGRIVQCHAYLNGLHSVELVVAGRRCAEPFQLKAYRIR